jgi:hypothetical protein
LIAATAYGTIRKRSVPDVIRDRIRLSEQIMLQQIAGAKIGSI